MTYTVIPVTTARQLRIFVKFPLKLYRGNPYYVPPLIQDEIKTFNETFNPAYAFCESRLWLVYHDRTVVGRIAGICNHRDTNGDNKVLRFGWMDFENDPVIAKLLLQQVEKWARDLAMDVVQGPMGFTNFDHAGLLVDGFQERATLAASYNYPYYPGALEKAGYSEEVEWVEYRIKIPPLVPERILKLAEIIQKRYHVAAVSPGSKAEMMQYARSIFELLNQTYGHLHGVVSLTERQIDYYTRKYLPFMRKDFIALVVNEAGQLIAFGIAMPSLAKALQKAGGTLFPLGLLHILLSLKKNKEAEMLLVAVHPTYQNKGINALLMKEMHEGLLRQQITVAESNPELSDNRKVQSIWSCYDAWIHKKRKGYRKFL